MNPLRDAPPLPSMTSARVAAPGIAEEVEAWLREQSLPEEPVRWRRCGASAVPVSGREELGIRVSRLSALGSWGVVRRVHGDRWGQTMRVDGGWIVEVNGVPGPDCFARRVRSDGTDVFASHDEAADILWAWLAGRLVAGHELVEL